MLYHPKNICITDLKQACIDLSVIQIVGYYFSEYVLFMTSTLNIIIVIFIPNRYRYLCIIPSSKEQNDFNVVFVATYNGNSPTTSLIISPLPKKTLDIHH